MNKVSGEYRYLATCPHSHPMALDLLTEVACTQVLVQIANNPRTSQGTLAKLARHENPDVRAAVSENDNASFDLIAKLAADANPDVRYAVAENHNIPLEILRALTNDDNPYVAARAQKTIQRVGKSQPALFFHNLNLNVQVAS